jgi:predicted DCC family thiol-disulfide oxidoreductase YuxK
MTGSPVPGGLPVILYDAGCNLCRGSVAFVKDHGGETLFRFVPLGSSEAEHLLPDGVGGCDTLHLIDAEGHHDRSTAALRIARHLKHPWTALRFFRFIPRDLRDAVYDFVARHRLAWFGRAPDDDVRDRP